MCDKQVYHDPFLDDLDRIQREGEKFRKLLEGDSDLARMVQEIRAARK
jgi:hypothetical protein